MITTPWLMQWKLRWFSENYRMTYSTSILKTGKILSPFGWSMIHWHPDKLGWALHAAGVLDTMQPYLGDPCPPTNDSIQSCFSVVQWNVEEYMIYNKCWDFGTFLPSRLIGNPHFCISEWYACQLGHQERHWSNFTWTVPIRDAQEMNTSVVLRSGITSDCHR